ncbi:MAG: DUF222 domain-containing protein [Actinomycetota bacterium]
MSTLWSGIDEIQGTELRYLGDGEVVDLLTEVRGAMSALAAEDARILAEIERREIFSRDGHLSITSWVESRFHTSFSEAAKGVRMARGLEQMPATKEALAEGEVSQAAVGMLLSAREANPEEFARAEDTLLEAARSLPVRDLRRAVEHWREVVEPEAAARDEAERFSRRGLHVSPTFEGMVRVDGNLDPETGQCLITALGAVTDPWVRGGERDDRTPAQRRADGLGEVCRGFLDRSDRPVIAGERPHVTITMDLEALEARAGYRCELTDAGRVAPESARRLACDASVSRVITAGGSEPLEVGRRTPVVPASLRRAVVVRDHHCRFPGCDRPASWCDCHHVVHWADGGRTDLSNLELLCRRHHRMVHAGFGLAMTDHGPVFTREDGTVIEGRAPP